ncbi:Gluconokinase (EC 2.7.1.12), partial [Arthrobacter sp. DR-2P]
AESPHASCGHGRSRVRQNHPCGGPVPPAGLGLRRGGRVPSGRQHRQDDRGHSAAGRGPLALAPGNPRLDDRPGPGRLQHRDHLLGTEEKLPPAPVRSGGPRHLPPPRRRCGPDQRADAGPRRPLHAARPAAQPAGHPRGAQPGRARRRQSPPRHLAVTRTAGRRGRAGPQPFLRPGAPRVL